ncbi:unnamed protein product [Rhizophagus irregularis]|uniref:Uncharacterized protein n=1 Tax=Rhizophagus irregularis TaxID=588596 RepID=A0A2I1HRC7_9GLOM|nr:hypothetical protein RhiirA4_486356 [Rhizophagus irregularis]CAB4429114.1 unnamed protein product [Rhizophagus irregularis]
MEDKPPLLDGSSYKVAISQYFEEMSKLIRDTLKTRWPDLKFSIIMTNPTDLAKKLRKLCVNVHTMLCL